MEPRQKSDENEENNEDDIKKTLDVNYNDLEESEPVEPEIATESTVTNLTEQENFENNMDNSDIYQKVKDNVELNEIQLNKMNNIDCDQNNEETMVPNIIPFEETVRTKVLRSESPNDDLDELMDLLEPASGYNSNEEDLLDDFIQVSVDEAEERLRAKRLARAEAKEIRMRELERQQKEQEENADRQFDMLAEPLVTSRVARSSVSRYLSSRRSSEDSLEDGGSLREIRHELKEWEDKFRKAMVINAQLDNEKTSLTFQVELLKDRIEEIEEEQSLLRREHRDKCREHDQLKRLCAKLKYDLEVVAAELDERDRLIKEQGFVMLMCEDSTDASSSTNHNDAVTMPKRTLVKMENAKLLEECDEESSLDVRLSKFAKEKSELLDEISHLKLELEEEKSKKRKATSNGPLSDYDIDGNEFQKDGNSLLADYKFRAQKAEQDVATLQATIARLESQVVRYKSASEASEKLEETLKSEKRKFQREAREAQNRAEELETANLHLLKRLDKLKNAKSALLKEL